MTCRTPTGPQVCTSSSQTGAKFTYDVEDRLIQWVSADGATTVNYGYDGEGNRFEMQVSTGSTTTTTTYLSNLEESTSVNGGTAAVTGYFYFGSQRIGAYQNSSGAWDYFLSDNLTSTTVAVNSGGVVAAQLFGPYGQARWAGGTMPTSYAFTGQRADSATGLDDYGARYYDPAAGSFTSADTAGGGNRYGYVAGNPETLTDPTGHRRACSGCGGGGGSGGGGQKACRFGAEDCAALGEGTVSRGGFPTATGARCGGSAQICHRIEHDFNDVRTVVTLFTMLFSVTGAEFVEYLLAEAERLGGDNFIKWDETDPTAGAYTDFFGNIHMNPTIISAGGLAGVTEAAGALTHEAVESYFAIAKGIRFQASQHMDYVAEWFAGQVKNQINEALGLDLQATNPSILAQSAYNMDFNTWQGTPDGQYYSSKNSPSYENPTEWDESGLGADAVARLASDPNAPNPMGLSIAMLSSPGLFYGIDPIPGGA